MRWRRQRRPARLDFLCDGRCFGWNRGRIKWVHRLEANGEVVGQMGEHGDGV